MTVWRKVIAFSVIGLHMIGAKSLANEIDDGFGSGQILTDVELDKILEQSGLDKSKFITLLNRKINSIKVGGSPKIKFRDDDVIATTNGHGAGSHASAAQDKCEK